MDSFAENSSLIAGYPDGRIIEVTYFSQNSPITDTQSSIVDLSSWTKDDVHISWTEIRNFELRLPDGMNFEYDQDSNNSTMDGSALTFPGFLPKPGDFFIYTLRNAQIGIFYISSIARLAIGQETYHRITYTLQDFLTETMRDRLRKQAGDPWYFDKTKYLVGNYAMLSSTGYINQKELRQLRREIIRNYTDRFYKSEFSSFIRPDKVYDPYVVEFWNKKISYDECHLRPTQLLIAIQNYHKTIWAAMTGNPIRDLKNVEKTWTLATYSATFWGANITSLLGNTFLAVGHEEGARQPSNISNYGEPILVDSTPFFSQSPSREDMQALNDRAFMEARMKFYEGFLPFRKCAPHHHPVDFPMCDEKKCIECTSAEDGSHHIHKNQPPYPILSNDELGIIWRRLNNVSATAILTDAQLAAVRGYILWYRTTYEGTLSHFELEAEWRTKAGLAPTQHLTDAEYAGLVAYIKSYRSQFQPVLTDRELEMIWRTKQRVSYEYALTDPQLIDFAEFVIRYRDAHGAAPDDGFNVVIPDIGRPFTAEELSNAGALMYGDTIILGDIILTELEKLMTGDAPLPPRDPIPANYVPTVYKQEYPRPNHQIHCHDVCHEKCGRPTPVSSEKKEPLSASYALSNEFYLGSIAMDPFEKLVHDALTNKEIDPSQVANIIKQYLDWPDMDAFYRHLFAIYLIDKSLHWLRYHS